ncbi:hypothetical protein H5410_015295 [Solanum commersonii]|uniref:Uncharacterized protein n=1 Tax=Solanum commersonii TaxID=4109 RepID=A0A9J5ZU16_SOLCO|nr:hypothetical protein H5410_015295 [Solanum commersonii]
MPHVKRKIVVTIESTDTKIKKKPRSKTTRRKKKENSNSSFTRACIRNSFFFSSRIRSFFFFSSRTMSFFRSINRTLGKSFYSFRNILQENDLKDFFRNYCFWQYLDFPPNNNAHFQMRIVYELLKRRFIF